MTLANAMILVDQTAVPLILPSIMHDFQAGSQQVQWVVNASLLPLAGLLVFGGKLGDVLGRRRVFVVGAVLFAGASACAGLAPSLPVLIAFRVLQGIGGALMLPNTVSIVSAALTGNSRGKALGTMGGLAAFAGALGPSIGGILTNAFNWRVVLLVNVPLALLSIVIALRAVPVDPPRKQAPSIELGGTALLCIALIGFVFGVTQSQVWGWGSVPVILALVCSLLSATLFFTREKKSRNPMLDMRLLRRYPNYRAATISQGIGGMVEMGLGLLLPLFLILNLGMSPAQAGLALIPATIPMIFVAPLAGKWYDRVGGKPGLMLGFAGLSLSGILLAIAVFTNTFLWLLPGLLLYGIALALILTINDPVTLDTLPTKDHGQASGVSATAEQFGGALGIACLYLLFHNAYVHKLHELVPQGAAYPSNAELLRLKEAIIQAEQTGLRPTTFNPQLSEFLIPAQRAADFGHAVVFLSVSALAIIGCLVAAKLVARPGVKQ